MTDQLDPEELYAHFRRAEGKKVILRTLWDEFEGILQVDPEWGYRLLYRAEGTPCAVSLDNCSQLRVEGTTPYEPPYCFSTEGAVSTRSLYGLEGMVARFTLWRIDIPQPDSVQALPLKTFR